MRIEPLRDYQLDAALAVLPLHRLGGGEGLYLVAWDDDEPVGHAHLALLEPPELQDVFVRLDRRRSGIATALTHAAEDEARARGATKLRLDVSIDNTPAQRLYEKLGYAGAGLPPRRVQGVVQIRTGPLEVDDMLLILEKRL